MENCRQAVAEKDIRKIYGKRVFGGKANLHGKGQPVGKPLWKGTTAEDITKYVVENHLEVLDNILSDNRKERDITELPYMAQFRTTRRIDGEYTFTAEDVYRHFDDSISVMNDFERRHFLYEIPCRVMYKKGFDNLLAAGRITSGEGYGWDLLRVIPTAIITGQAAGVAASIAIDDKTTVSDIDISKLQKSLEKQNVIIHFDDALVNNEILSVNEVNNEADCHI